MILENLWRGNILPCQQCGADDPELQNLLHLMAHNTEDLKNKIGTQAWESFEKFMDCSNEYWTTLTEKAFCDGFCLASQLLTETLMR